VLVSQPLLLLAASGGDGVGDAAPAVVWLLQEEWLLLTQQLLPLATPGGDAAGVTANYCRSLLQEEILLATPQLLLSANPEGEAVGDAVGITGTAPDGETCGGVGW